MVSGFLDVPSILRIQRYFERCVIVGFLGISQSLLYGIEVLVAEGHPKFMIQIFSEELQSHVEVT